MRRNLINDRLDRQSEDRYIEGLIRPGREGQATVGHAFLGRSALTKANPHYDSYFTSDGAGGWVPTTYAVYGFSTYGGTEVYMEG